MDVNITSHLVQLKMALEDHIRHCLLFCFIFSSKEKYWCTQNLWDDDGENVIAIRTCASLNDLKTVLLISVTKNVLCCRRGGIVERWEKVENDEKYFD